MAFPVVSGQGKPWEQGEAAGPSRLGEREVRGWAGGGPSCPHRLRLVVTALSLTLLWLLSEPGLCGSTECPPQIKPAAASI